MSAIVYDPTELELDRLFDQFIRDLGTTRRGRRQGGGQRKYVPSIDLYEQDNEYIVTAELPGLDKNDINVEVRENSLILSGEAKRHEKYAQNKAHIQERRWGRFSRTIDLPKEIKSTAIEAKYKDGVLELTIPKSEAAQPKKIKIG
ncbi:4699_t:CDS:2 [Paraglomus occultum]|uniref:4699_t:CDS:1 n=1 Tax=Paraglomus occultum TaxID=144539 RepID=A0A9N9ALJ8_9GLOM|nr:4699_t:CDS:2 [Paraglomus occultum]